MGAVRLSSCREDESTIRRRVLAVVVDGDEGDNGEEVAQKCDANPEEQSSEQTTLRDGADALRMTSNREGQPIHYWLFTEIL